MWSCCCRALQELSSIAQAVAYGFPCSAAEFNESVVLMVGKSDGESIHFSFS